MGVYNNNKDGTRSTLANTIQVVDAPMEQFLSRGEFNAVTPSDVSADNKLVAENEVTKAVDTMPTASADLVGTIVQYVGTTTANYTNGYFYKCDLVDNNYIWVVVNGENEGYYYEGVGNQANVLNDIDNQASGNCSHAQNNHTIAQGDSQTAIGRYNIPQGTAGSYQSTDYAFVVGNGTNDANRSNAFAVKWDGTLVFADGTEQSTAGGGSGGSNEIENVATLRQTNLNIGDVVHTLGYLTAKDKGGATYQIRANSGSEVDNAGDIIVLTNGLVAEMVAENRVSMKAFGVISSTAADTSVQATNSTRLQNALNYADSHRIVLAIPSGTYYFSAAISITKLEGVVVEGEGKAELHYLGNSDFITINSMIDVIFRNVYFYSPNANGALLKILKASTATTRNKLENCQFYGGFYGIDINSVSYLYIDKCNVLGESTSRDAVDSAAINMANCEYIYITCSTIEKYNNGIVINGSQFIYITECDIPNFKGLWDSTNEVLTGGFGVKIFSDANVSVNSNTIYINNNSFLRTIRMIGVLTLTNKKLSKIFAHENFYMTADCNWSDKGSVLYLDATNAQIQTVDVLDTYIADYSGRTRPTYTYKTVTGGNCYDISVSDSNDATPSTFDGTGIKNYTSTSKLRSRVPNDFQVTENTTLSADMATFTNGELVINGGNWFYPFVYMNFSVACAITSVYSGSTGQELYFKARKPFSVVPSGNFCKNLNSTLTIKTGETLKLRKIGLSDAWIAEIVDKDIPSADLPWVTPQDYGAVGDGVTDDSAAIQAAFNAGGNVYFPIGTYLVSGYVSVKSNTNVHGEYGKSIIIIDQTKDTDGTIVYFGMNGYGIENVLFENMVIHGSETYGVPQHGISCAQIWESENITFKNCIFRNNLYAASIMVKSSKVSYFGCRFEATDCGVQCLGSYPCSDVTIKDCFFSGLSYYNNFTNYQSEPIAIYQGIQNNGPAKRWIIDSCEFEYKHTNAIALGNANILPTGEDKIQVEDCSIRNITARSVVGVMAFTACRNVIAENIFYDGTDNIFSQTSSLYNITNFNAYCDSVTVRCVKSDNDELLAPFTFGATSKNCMIDDAQICGAISTLPTIQLQGTNHTIKGVVVNAKTKNGAVQYQNATNSYVDVKAAVGSAYPITHSFAANSTNTGNTIIVHEDSLYPITKLNNVASQSVANANTFNIVTESIVKKSTTTTRYINSSDLCSIVSVSIADSTTFENCMTTYDSWGLLEDGHKMTVEFNCAQALSSRDFKLPSTGNILPINSDTYKLAPAATYTVVEKFVQTNGKWAEIERYARYPDGRMINIVSTDPSTDIDFSTVLGGN